MVSKVGLDWVLRAQTDPDAAWAYLIERPRRHTVREIRCACGNVRLSAEPNDWCGDCYPVLTALWDGYV